LVRDAHFCSHSYLADKNGTRKFSQDEMRCVQARQLFHHPEQEKTQREIANEKTLQILQKTHIAQGNKIEYFALSG